MSAITTESSALIGITVKLYIVLCMKMGFHTVSENVRMEESLSENILCTVL